MQSGPFGSQGDATLSFLRNCQSVFQRNCRIRHSHRQCRGGFGSSPRRVPQGCWMSDPRLPQGRKGVLVTFPPVTHTIDSQLPVFLRKRPVQTFCGIQLRCLWWWVGHGGVFTYSGWKPFVRRVVFRYFLPTAKSPLHSQNFSRVFQGFATSRTGPAGGAWEIGGT